MIEIYRLDAQSAPLTRFLGHESSAMISSKLYQKLDLCCDHVVSQKASIMEKGMLPFDISLGKFVLGASNQAVTTQANEMTEILDAEVGEQRRNQQATRDDYGHHHNIIRSYLIIESDKTL
jgi:hypothetical protein